MNVENIKAYLLTKKDIQALKLRPRSLHVLVSQLILVIYGIRDAYLIDCCSIDIVAAKIVKSQVLQYLKINYGGGDEDGNIVKAILLGDFNVMYIHVESLRRKLHQPIDKSLPIIITIESDIPKIIHSSQKQDFILKIQSLFLPIESSIIEINDDSSPVIKELGYPFIAGWLLDYPCIYHIGTNRNSENVLNSQILRKFSLFVNGIKESERKSKKYSNSEIDQESNIVMEFTIPKSVIDSDDEIMKDISLYLQSKVDIMSSISSKLHHLSLAMKLTETITLIYKTEDIFVTSVIL